MVRAGRPARSRGGGGGYISPVPGGTIGRTDMGVDISARPGTRIRAITRERLVGIIRNWYQGQPFYWFQQLDARGRATGIYNYVAEQVASPLHIGQTVNAGDTVGVVTGSGTGLELGWATRSGQTMAQATTGYREGQGTPAGTSYKSQVINHGRRGGGGVPSQKDSLAQLWIDAGGNPHLANIMAAIALAESGGRVGAQGKNTNGTVDRGLWQINSSHSQYDAKKLLTDPLYNAKAAVAIEKSQGLAAWTTYQTGAYRQYLHAKSPKYAVGAKYGGSRPGGQSTKDSGASVTTALNDYVGLRDTTRTAPPGTKNVFAWWWASFSGNWDQLHTDTGT